MPVLALTKTRVVVLAAPAVVAASFTPLSLSPFVWYEGDGISLSNGASVSQWDDLSGNARHLTQATGSLQPTYQTNQLNTKPVIRFDGTDDVLSTANQSPGITTGDYTIAVVAKAPASLSGYHAMTSYGSETPAWYFNGAGEDLYHGGDHNFGVTLSVSTWYTFVVARTAGTLACFINGTDTGTNPTASASIGNGSPFHCGAGGGAASLGTDLAAVLWMTSAITSGDRVSLQNYWRTKYAHY